MRRYIFAILIIIQSLMGYSQNIWESAKNGESLWEINNNLVCKRTDNSISLENNKPIRYRDVENKISMSDSEKISILTDIYPSASFDTKLLGSGFELSFTIINNTKPKGPPISSLWPDTEHERISFWTIDVEAYNESENIKTDKIWVIRTNWDDTQEFRYKPGLGYWESYRDGVVPRNVKISLDNSKLSVYINNNCVSSIMNINSIKKINIAVAGGTNIEIKNTIYKRMTTYGQALPYLEKAANYLEHNNPSSAASEMTTAINKGLKCYDTFLMRGVAYYAQGYYKSAIEDLTSAIDSSTSNKELAYYYRGMSKLALDDDYGINDLKNGGQDGLVFLRENNLMNYTPGQNKKNTTTTTKRKTTSSQAKRKTTTSQPKKQALKK